MTFFEMVAARARTLDSLLCVGLDPHPADLPEDTPAAARDACLRLIAATHAHAVVFKPNAAFFERHGAAGVEALREVIAGVPDGVPVLLDAKRGDIASTAEAYADAAFDALGAHAITVSPYLGRDGVEPFARRADRGVFVLCRTSNPSAGDLQDLPAPVVPLHLEVARVAPSWSPHANIGLVVGATRPEELAAVRAAAPEAWILAPGVGAQGGSLEETVRAGVRADGLGLLVNVSRGLSRAADPAAEAERLVGAMRAAGRGGAVDDPRIGRIADGLLEAGCVRFGRFTLKSGLTSPFYLDLRRLAGFPRLLADIGAALAAFAEALPHDVIAALPYAAMPIGAAMSLAGGRPMVYPRREVKAYGTKAEVEGVFATGQRALVIDDLATRGDSKIEGAEKLRAVGLVVEDVLVIVDRESGADRVLAEAGLRLHALVKVSWLLDRWERSGKITAEQAAEVRDWLKGA